MVDERGSALPTVAAIAGGVGGAKLVDGLARDLPLRDLAVVVNTGDDFEHFGLWISPDLDTVCYTLAGIANPETGWGRAGERWQAMETVEMLGGPIWFRLGDRDLGTHLERTRRLRAGDPLSAITRAFCRAWGVETRVMPMSDQPVATRVHTLEGELSFQEYFVQRACAPRVEGFQFEGAAQAQPAPGVLSAIAQADLIVICPSNPWVSVDPVLAVPGIRQALCERPVVAVSPIVGGQALKGPAAKMYREMGMQPSPVAVARHYGDLLNGFVMDQVDREQAPAVEALGMPVLVAQTIMRSERDRQRLAQQTLEFGVKQVLDQVSIG